MHVRIFSFTLYSDIRAKDVIVLCEKLTNLLDDTRITVEAKYSVNITEFIKNLCLSILHNGANSFLYANHVKI